MFVLYPMIEVGVIRRVWLDIVFAAFLAMGAMFVFEPRPLVRLFLTLLGCAVVVSLVDHFFESLLLAALRSLLTMLATAILGALLLSRVMRDGRMNFNRIMGAIGSYLLIGIVFTQAYRLLAGFIPGAFAIGGSAADYATISQKLSYFSFITLTSTGYGDITPVHPYARSLATMEALAGNLFLAVLVARLVGQEIDWRHEQRDLRRAEAAAKRQNEDRSNAGRGLLDRQQRAHVVGVHRGARPPRHHLAARHDDVVVGERLGEIVILLDQQDRHLAALRELADRALDVLDDGWLDAFGRLVQDQQLWAQRERAADRELLLLTAGQVAAPAIQHVLQHREHFVDESGDAHARSSAWPIPSADFRGR